MTSPARDASVPLGGRPLRIEDVASVARGGAPVEATAAARARMLAARAVVERADAASEPVYGLTTGLGAGVDTPISADDRVAFQHRVPRARAVAVGRPLPAERVRAMMLMRASTMAAGGSGASPGVLDAFVGALNAGVTPRVPSLGSIGAADLSQLAHVALALMGEGTAEFRGEALPAADALARAGLAPVRLATKDGHAMIIVNALSVGHGALVLVDAARVLRALEASVALSFEGLRANLSPIDPRVHAARPSPGAPEAAARIRALLEGSGLWTAAGERHVHDPLSFRSATQVHGVALDSWDRARAVVETELNAPSDNPLILGDEGVVLHNSSFDATALALAFETLGQALAHGATAAAWRALKLMSPRFSELPRFLTPLGQTRTGFATVQKTLSSLEMEIRHLANPCSLAPLPVADGQEDVAQMAALAVDKADRIVERLRYVAAIGLVAAAQACDLRPVAPERMGTGARAAYRFVRDRVERLEEDRSQGPDFERVAEAIAAGGLDAAVGA
jgi:histidine ammonia-lyase